MPWKPDHHDNMDQLLRGNVPHTSELLDGKSRQGYTNYIHRDSMLMLFLDFPIPRPCPFSGPAY